MGIDPQHAEVSFIPGIQIGHRRKVNQAIASQSHDTRCGGAVTELYHCDLVTNSAWQPPADRPTFHCPLQRTLAPMPDDTLPHPVAAGHDHPVVSAGCAVSTRRPQTLAVSDAGRKCMEYSPLERDGARFPAVDKVGNDDVWFGYGISPML